MNKTLYLTATTLIITGCTAVDVSPVSKSHNMTHVCIEENPKVIIRGFTKIIEDRFEKHLITTELYSGAIPDDCQFKLKYTALRSWDFAPYLSYAELDIYSDNRKVGYAEYRLRGNGGFSLMKWQGAKTKMDPVLDQLLSEY